MLPPINTFGAASLAFTLVLGCGTADSTRHASGGSSSANPDAAPAATPVAARSAQTPTDSISARADRGRIQGNADAKLWIIEASDFQCPFCKTWHDSAYGLVIRDYVKTGKTRMAYLNFPLSQHKNAMPAAEAAMCASVQDKFWPMHDALFTTQQQWEALPNPEWQKNKALLAATLPPIKIALIGDSTVASYPKPPEDRPTLTGWGQVFGLCFRDSVEIKNHAVSGRSSKS